MAGPEFANCWLKIGRAEEHFFKQELAAWIDSKPHVVTQKRDPQGRRYSLVLESLDSSPFDRWALIAGDCAHNLRSALDHLVYALAVQKSGTNPPPSFRRLQFPIADSPAQFEEQRSRVSTLSAKAQAFIEGAQPYNTRHPHLPHPLSVLGEFDNTDKHRLLNVAFSHLIDGKIDFVPPLNRVIDIHWLKNPLKRGAEFMFFDMDPPQLDVGYNYEVFFVVTVGHVPGPKGRNISILEDVLRAIIADPLCQDQ